MNVMQKSLSALLVTSALIATSASLVAKASEFELSGKVGIEQRYFVNDGQFDDQLNSTQLSVFAEPELYWSWNDGADSLTFKPFYRYDERDDERSHGDIRELSFVHADDDWEFRFGIRKEFWGVTEFQHLADVINQTDGVEDFDGEDKLGQQMINLSLVNDWGIVDLYLLPGFRERTFAGSSGRLRGGIVVDDDNVQYESSAKDNHLDTAIRWSHSINVFDIGAYWFQGTNREPILTPVSQPSEKESVVLQQYYSQMDQFGLDVQATINDWLWKFETIYRNTNEDDFWATQAGFEYTYVGIFESNADLGLLTEYGWDSRGEADENSPGASVQNDIFFGARLAFNDMQSSELLMGVSADLDHNANSFIFEGNRRFGESFKVSLDIRLMNSSEPLDFLYNIKEDDHLQLAIEYFY